MMKNVTKKLLGTLLGLVLSVSVSAYDFEVDGIYYNVVSLQDLTAEVTSGTTAYTSTVSIPSTATYMGRTFDVIAIGSSTFYNCRGLTSVIIPESVTSIGSSAFSGCSGLTSVIIPESVTSIGSSAFSGCSGLTSVTIPNSVTTIGSYTFEGCSNLISVFYGNITNIEHYAFMDCKNLLSFTFPKSVKSIGHS